MKGSSTVEFVLVLPWLVGFFLVIVWMTCWVMQADFKYYNFYKADRVKEVQIVHENIEGDNAI